MKKEIIEWVKALGFALVLGLVITTFIGGTKVSGNSMNPTLQDGDFLITYNFINKINRGDVVVVKTDLEINEKDIANLNILNRWRVGKYKKLIKRIIAVEGDSIVIKDGNVILNGVLLDEKYINGNNTPGNISIDEIPEGKVFVMGDNRINSLDSRSKEIGLIDEEDIIGKAIIRVYPFSHIGIVE
ncbi:MAG: signal peptidase I [Tissierellia bacterium]|nr:signal peptidase I [Tissierellia bacterium]